MNHNLFFFFFNDTATTEIYTLSLHDALPICSSSHAAATSSTATVPGVASRMPEFWSQAETSQSAARAAGSVAPMTQDRKSTRLNSSHANISYAVFCLKKKK